MSNILNVASLSLSGVEKEIKFDEKVLVTMGHRKKYTFGEKPVMIQSGLGNFLSLGIACYKHATINVNNFCMDFFA